MKINYNLDFSQNLNAFGCPPKIINLLKKEIEKINSYPEKDFSPGIGPIAEHFHISPEEIALGNGTSEIIFNLPRLLPKGRVVILAPTFWEYKAANKRESANIIEKYYLTESNSFDIDFQDFGQKIKDAKTVFICNPNNPTSTILDRKKLLDLISANPNVNFVVDETYLIFRSDYNTLTLVPEAAKLENLYVLLSLSKFFCIPGLRIGFLFSSQFNIQKYLKVAIPYTTNRLVQSVLPHIFTNKTFISKSRLYYEKSRVEFVQKINKLFNGKLLAFPAQTGFILVKILDQNLANTIIDSLLEYGIKVRSGTEFDGLGKEWMRVNIKNYKDNRILINTLEEIIYESH